MMKKIVLSGFIIVFFTITGFAQDKMMVDNQGRFPGEEPLHHPITTLTQLPAPIVDSIKSILKNCLGDFLPKIHFQNGQINDLKLYAASKDNNNFRSYPKYEVFYLLMDKSLGIRNFPVEIGLDENGHLLKVTWPRKGCTSPSVFLSRSIIKAAAFNLARKHHFIRTNYKVDLIFDDTKQKFFWQFDFYEDDGDSNYIKIDEIKVNRTDVNDFEIIDASQVVIN